MFGRNKKRNPEGPALIPPAPITIGSVALGGVARAEGPTTPEKPYASEVSARVIELAARQSEFLKKAAADGVTLADLPGVVAAAMNAGELPRIIRGMGLRSEAVLRLFDGKVPAEAFQTLHDETDGDFQRRLQDGDIGLLYTSDTLHKVESDAGTFTTERLVLPLVHDGHQTIDDGMLGVLECIDKHLYPQGPQHQ